MYDIKRPSFVIMQAFLIDLEGVLALETVYSILLSFQLTDSI